MEKVLIAYEAFFSAVIVKNIKKFWVIKNYKVILMSVKPNEAVHRRIS